VIKAYRTLEAEIGADETVKFRLTLDAEHALMFAKILDITQLVPADWLAKVLREELLGLGVAVPAEPLEWAELLQKHKEPHETPQDAPQISRQTTIPGT
jgi:hypothetical protein